MRITIRPTAILVEDNKLLLVQERVTKGRVWSLPGGALKPGESLEACLIREVREETGLAVRVGELLYLCDRITEKSQVLHITFRVHRANNAPLASEKQARMVPLSELVAHGFTPHFCILAEAGFPNPGSYVGAIQNIGL